MQFPFYVVIFIHLLLTLHVISSIQLVTYVVIHRQQELLKMISNESIIYPSGNPFLVVKRKTNVQTDCI